MGKASPVGFEPTRGDPIGLAGRRLSCSAKVSLTRSTGTQLSVGDACSLPHAHNSMQDSCVQTFRMFHVSGLGLFVWQHVSAIHLLITGICLMGKATPVGFEPTRGDPIGLAGRRLSRSAKVS